ncbi:tyrosine-type recombinase/integrase [Nocardia sp. NPDC049526]|uniref:tyrosine-type recombinase/integrase n=1 Tax=Nocardia sp. NPDC049526 TaxID=3364316 RepID=UPI00379459E9
MDRPCVTRRLRRLAQDSAMRLPRMHPHMLRHTFVTTMLDAGVDLRDVQIAARHADPRTTMRYDRARPPLELHPRRLHGLGHITTHHAHMPNACGGPDWTRRRPAMLPGSRWRWRRTRPPGATAALNQRSLRVLVVCATPCGRVVADLLCHKVFRVLGKPRLHSGRNRRARPGRRPTPDLPASGPRVAETQRLVSGER